MRSLNFILPELIRYPYGFFDTLTRTYTIEETLPYPIFVDLVAG